MRIMVVLLLALLSAGPVQAQTAARTLIDGTEWTPLVMTYVVGIDEETLELPGRVQAARRSELAFREAGLLIQRPVVAGQRVAAGDLLAQMDPQDLQIRVDLEAARLSLAQADFDRFSRLAESRVSPVTPADLDRQRATLDIATVRAEQARADLDDATMRAPFDGIVAATLVENHQRVRADQPVLLFDSSDALEVVVDVPEHVVSRIRSLTRDETVGEAVFAVVPGRRFPVRVSEIATRADPGTQTFRVTLAMARPDDINLLPGMTATVYARPFLVLEPVLRVPLSALGRTETGTAFVWVVDPETAKLRRQDVVVGEIQGGGAVVEQGLLGGETVVAAGVAKLREGLTIQRYRIGMLSY